MSKIIQTQLSLFREDYLAFQIRAVLNEAIGQSNEYHDEHR